MASTSIAQLLAAAQAPSDATSTSTSTPSSGVSAPNADKLRVLAAQFESLFLSQMLREMRGGMFGDDDTNKDTGFGDSPLTDTMYSQLGVALSQAGGIGLAQSMLGPLMQQAGSEPTSVGGLAMVATGPNLAAIGGTDPVSAATAASFAIGTQASAMLAPSSIDGASGIAAAVSGMPGRLSSSYGWRQDPINGGAEFHKGVDLALPPGSDVPAARAGQVTFAGEMAGYGLTVEVSHGNGVSTRYGHLSQLDVKVGDTVTAGQTIALSGSTGKSTGPHLHFEVLDQGQAVDPSTGWSLLQTGSGNTGG